MHASSRSATRSRREITLAASIVAPRAGRTATPRSSAVDSVDSLRAELNDGENLEPPELRSDLLKLHGLAMAVVNEGERDKASKMFDLAMDLENQISGIRPSWSTSRKLWQSW